MSTAPPSVEGLLVSALSLRYNEVMNPEEFNEFESRYYLAPTVSRDSQLSFIDTLRDVQARNTAQINADTYRLGTQVPSNLGGLGGAENTFVARYQKPQTEQTVADLRTAAQSSALNTALSNLQNAYKKRYNDAMLNYQRRAATPSTNPANNGDGSNTDPTFSPFDEVTTEETISTVDENDTVVVPNDRGGSSVYRLKPDGSIGEWLYDLDANNNRIDNTAKNNASGVDWGDILGAVGAGILGGGVPGLGVAGALWNLGKKGGLF